MLRKKYSSSSRSIMSNITGVDDEAGTVSNTTNTGGGRRRELHEYEEEELILQHDHLNGNCLNRPGTRAPTSGGSGTRTNNYNNSSASLQEEEEEQPSPLLKKKRSLPGTPDPSAEVIALSPTTLMTANRFVCEICNKGFQRDQNLQLHRRGHNLPWKLKQRSSTEVKKRVYICPEPSCVHHNPFRALGDLTGIKKHFSRKHGEKKWECEKCSKKYAVQSDWKAHSKTCGTREYKCDCGTIFPRRDSFITHRAFCEALACSHNNVNQELMATIERNLQEQLVSNDQFISSIPLNNSTNRSIPISEFDNAQEKNPLKSFIHDLMSMPLKPLNMTGGMSSSSSGTYQLNASGGLPSYDGLNNTIIGQQMMAGSAHMSATALLQKAAQMGASASSNMNSPMMQKSFVISGMAGLDQIPEIRPSPLPYEGMMQSQTELQSSQLHGNDCGGFLNQFISTTAAAGDDSSSTGVMDNMAMLNGLMFMGGSGGDHQNLQNGFLMKNMENETRRSNSMSLSPGRTTGNSVLGITGDGQGSTATRLSRFGGSRDMMTVDFLGISGGSRASGNSLDEQQQKQRMELGAISQERLHSLQQELSHEQEGLMEKRNTMWDF